MAHALLTHRLGADGPAVASAGVGAPVGEPPTPHALDALAARGIEPCALHARAVSSPMVLQHDLVLAAEANHVRALLRLAPGARGRIFRLGHWRDVDIPDPIGRPYADYEACLALIETCVDDWIPHLQRPASHG